MNNVSKRDTARRARFIAYVKERFGEAVDKPRSEARAALMQKLGVTKGAMTQLFNQNESFGEKKAAGCAASLGLPEDYFEVDHAASPTDPRLARSRAHPEEFTDADRRRAEREHVLFLWDRLMPEQRNRLLAELEREHKWAAAGLTELERLGWRKPEVGEDVLPPKFTRDAQRELPIEPPAPRKKRGEKK